MHDSRKGNHLKSQSGDDPELPVAQARRVASIYQSALERSPYVVVAGDHDDEPSSEAIRSGTAPPTTRPSTPT